MKVSRCKCPLEKEFLRSRPGSSKKQNQNNKASLERKMLQSASGHGKSETIDRVKKEKILENENKIQDDFTFRFARCATTHMRGEKSRLAGIKETLSGQHQPSA